MTERDVVQQDYYHRRNFWLMLLIPAVVSAIVLVAVLIMFDVPWFWAYPLTALVSANIGLASSNLHYLYQFKTTYNL